MWLIRLIKGAVSHRRFSFVIPIKLYDQRIGVDTSQFEASIEDVGST